MAKHWARILMGLIFVFATIASPLHARPMPAAQSMASMPMASMPMDGMSGACAKAMMAKAAGTKPYKPVTGDHSGGCCADGCNCPLSHCPATPSVLTEGLPAPPADGAAVLAGAASRTLVSFPADTLIRPPRA